MVRDMVREEVGEICIRIRIKVVIKVKDRISTRVDRADMVVKDMPQINTVINTKVDTRIKVNTKTKGTRTKISIEAKAKTIMEILDHMITINTTLGLMLVQVISHLQTLLRGIILRTSSSPSSFSSYASSHPIPPPILISHYLMSRSEADQ